MEDGDCFKSPHSSPQKKGIACPAVTAGRNRARAVALNQPLSRVPPISPITLGVTAPKAGPVGAPHPQRCRHPVLTSFP